MGNAAVLINLALEATLQIQQYQLALSKAASENRDVTDAELESALSDADAAIEKLWAS